MENSLAPVRIPLRVVIVVRYICYAITVVRTTHASPNNTVGPVPLCDGFSVNRAPPITVAAVPESTSCTCSITWEIRGVSRSICKIHFAHRLRSVHAR